MIYRALVPLDRRVYPYYCDDMDNIDNNDLMIMILALIIIIGNVSDDGDKER